MPRRALPLLSFVFFLSGASALVFETLWFRRASLTFGNSVWASALVLSSFMAGLALGNGLAARFGHRVRRGVRFYAGLELVIACAGVALVLVFPYFTGLLALAFRPALEVPWLLQPLRFATAFALLLAPAVAMGATLPVLIDALSAAGLDFGRLLGRLYGWNTLGAVAGALSSELLWIPLFGIVGSAAVAGTLNLLAAALAYAVARAGAGAPAPPLPAEAPTPPRAPEGFAAARLLTAAFLAGGILLALEVVWFRTLVLFLANTHRVFAWMLASVLAGIGLGGLAAALWLRIGSRARAAAAPLALVSGAVSVYSYAGLAAVYGALGGGYLGDALSVLSLSAVLMFPASFCSGVLFTLLGARLREAQLSPVRAAGLLTLANTLGAMVGPLVAGFVLIPRIGTERSVWLLSAAYAAVALCALARPARSWLSPGGVALAAAAAAFAWAVVGFPSGLLNGLYLGLLGERFPETASVAASRQGVTETVTYLREDWLGEPYAYRLVTDGYSMSGSHPSGERYMSLFVHLPVALHPGPRNALLISYGVGTTAQALTEVDGLEAIDVVDISRDILELSDVRFGEGDRHPLRDSRVSVHVEDGRYFLETTSRRYDLITGEPPPPAYAGIVNLYTREYFELVRERLREGGFVSYWLPVLQLREQDAQAITRAFCDVFPDCSLWEGLPSDWMLLGSRGARGPVPETRFRAQWNDGVTGERLRRIGVEEPEQLLALFLADAPFLRSWSAATPPLVDDFPDRAPRLVPHDLEPYVPIMDARAARERFERSEWAAALLSEPLRAATLPYFRVQGLVRDLHRRRIRELPMSRLHRILEETSLRTLPLWLLGSEPAKQVIARRLAAREHPPAEALYELALGAIAERDYGRAAELLDRVPRDDRFPHRDPYEVYALLMDGRVDEAREPARAMIVAGELGADASFWAFTRQAFDFDGGR